MKRDTYGADLIRPLGYSRSIPRLRRMPLHEPIRDLVTTLYAYVSRTIVEMCIEVSSIPQSLIMPYDFDEPRKNQQKTFVAMTLAERFAPSMLLQIVDNSANFADRSIHSHGGVKEFLVASRPRTLIVRNKTTSTREAQQHAAGNVPEEYRNPSSRIRKKSKSPEKRKCSEGGTVDSLDGADSIIFVEIDE